MVEAGRDSALSVMMPGGFRVLEVVLLAKLEATLAEFKILGTDCGPPSEGVCTNSPASSMTASLDPKKIFSLLGFVVRNCFV